MAITLANGLPRTARPVILKVCANSSATVDWKSGGAQNAALQTAISDFKAQIAARYPTAAVRWHLVVMLGAQEGNNTNPDNTAALAMPGNFATLVTNLETYIGASFSSRIHGFEEGDGISTQPWLTEERASQVTMISNAGGYLLNVDSYDAYQSDGRHSTAAVLNAQGTQAGTSVLLGITQHPHLAANDNGAPVLYALPPARERRRRRRRLAA